MDHDKSREVLEVKEICKIIFRWSILSQFHWQQTYVIWSSNVLDLHVRTCIISIWWIANWSNEKNKISIVHPIVYKNTISFQLDQNLERRRSLHLPRDGLLREVRAIIMNHWRGRSNISTMFIEYLDKIVNIWDQRTDAAKFVVTESIARLLSIRGRHYVERELIWRRERCISVNIWRAFDFKVIKTDTWTMTRIRTRHSETHDHEARATYHHKSKDILREILQKKKNRRHNLLLHFDNLSQDHTRRTHIFSLSIIEESYSLFKSFLRRTRELRAVRVRVYLTYQMIAEFVNQKKSKSRRCNRHHYIRRNPDKNTISMTWSIFIDVRSS